MEISSANIAQKNNIKSIINSKRINYRTEIRKKNINEILN